MESLVVADPENLEYLRLLGRSYDMSGIRQFRKAHFAASKDSLRKAIATLERAHRTAPDNVEAARWLALAYADLGLLYQQTGHHTDRAKAFGRALAIFETLEQRSPTIRRHRLDRAECLVQLGA